MKVFISADIEGVTGLVSWSQCGRPDGQHYDYAWARERMTADVNAAIRGARAGGASEVWVKDSHNTMKNLLLDRLEPGTVLVSGTGATQGGMMTGLDRSFGAAMLIGYHAMAGTAEGIMEHTLTGYVHRLSLNGQPGGEIMLSAGMAGCFGVPIVTVSSDDKGCAEAQKLLPDVETAVVKFGLGRYMGRLLPPEKTEQAIFEAARRGVEKAPEIAPWLPESPVAIRIEFNRSEEADQAARYAPVKRIDGYTLEIECDTYALAHRTVWQLINHAGTASQS